MASSRDQGQGQGQGQGHEQVDEDADLAFALRMQEAFDMEYLQSQGLPDECSGLQHDLEDDTM